jgi:hypothetical protein
MKRKTNEEKKCVILRSELRSELRTNDDLMRSAEAAQIELRRKASATEAKVAAMSTHERQLLYIRTMEKIRGPGQPP